MANKKLNWKTWLQEGDQYLRAYGTKSRFGTEIRYNLISMSFEAYTMAILDFHNSLPENHTYSDLMYALETVVPIDKTLRERILKYENIQSICSIEKYHTVKPTEEELADLKGAILEISALAHKTCPIDTALAS
ncbi:hypothetical protein EC396_16405 [Lutibacter sp. HS1-25]|uniref:hypothetical protein n=1 Tax=Lutibacter sp. HS1-25 TaxID=2485000 RepID=UPI001011853E|nr:hypothetical protein [Lutibacter sp. HS1-25]RXP44967.1 hypothetical protein EC396_16405 [Lutibacter sp. HS1-25]